MTWDLDAELAAIRSKRYPRRQDSVIAAMWVYSHDLELAGVEFATEKTKHDRLLGRRIVSERAAGEKSAEVAAHKAVADDDEVFNSRLAYRVAEQRIVADRENLRRLHADLDDQRTQAADARAESVFMAQDKSVA